jgi:YHS domain-containing protein
MTTLICRTCGCSLVRLGISKNQAEWFEHNGNRYEFCCNGCVEVFKTDPERYLQETDDLIVCPTCLAEKPISRAVMIRTNKCDEYFCHCPRCAELYLLNPEFYIGRLNGSIPNKGISDHQGCCLRPDSEHK